VSAALALGAGAAIAWGVSSLTLAHAGRVAGTWTTTAWTGLTATLVTSIAASTTGPPGGAPGDWALVGLAGLAYTATVILFLIAVRGGEISLVIPIVGCDGAFAALLAVIAGEALGVLTGFGLAGMVFALVLVTGAAGDEDSPGRAGLPERRSTSRTVVLALATSFAFALVFFLSGKAGGIDPLWIVAGARSVPTVIAFVVCLRTGALRPPRSVIPWLAISGVIDAIAFVCYVEAARDSLAIAAVAASQYATLAAIGGVLVFGERLRSRQWIGVALLIAAATVVGAGG
jgi:drug/metabolite transporter (DMT)-like permease